MANGNGLERNLSDRRDDGGGVSSGGAEKLAINRDLGDIRVFEEGMATAQGEHPVHGEGAEQIRDLQRKVSSSLIDIAKANGLYIEPSKLPDLGDLISLHSKESAVYYNKEDNCVFKVKDPFAASGMKTHSPSDAIYEHIVHNVFFPEARYRFVGISEKNGDVRIILSQPFIASVKKVSDKAALSAADAKGFSKVDNYSMENKYVKITDFFGQNALIKEDSSIAFIDPVISHKKPAKEIIKAYLSHDESLKQPFGAIEKEPRQGIFQKAISWIRQRREEAIQETTVVDSYCPLVPEPLSPEEVDRLVYGRDPDYLKQLEETGRYDGWFLRSADYSDVFVIERLADGTVVSQESERIREALHARYKEGLLKMDGLTYEITPKQIDEMSVGKGVFLRCKETGEYRHSVYSLAEDKVISKAPYGERLREKLKADDEARRQERQSLSEHHEHHHSKGSGPKLT